MKPSGNSFCYPMTSRVAIRMDQMQELKKNEKQEGTLTNRVDVIVN